MRKAAPRALPSGDTSLLPSPGLGPWWPSVRAPAHLGATWGCQQQPGQARWAIRGASSLLETLRIGTDSQELTALPPPAREIPTDGKVGQSLLKIWPASL